MSQRFDQLDNHRQFLRFMAASPLLVHGAPGWLQLELGDDGGLPIQKMLWTSSTFAKSPRRSYLPPTMVTWPPA